MALFATAGLALLYAFIVLVDQAGQFQWPDGGYQQVGLAKGEWAGPIEEPGE